MSHFKKTRCYIRLYIYISSVRVPNRSSGTLPNQNSYSKENGPISIAYIYSSFPSRDQCQQAPEVQRPDDRRQRPGRRDLEAFREVLRDRWAAQVGLHRARSYERSKRALLRSTRNKDATIGAPGRTTAARTLLGAPGRTTRSKDTTSNKKLL